MFTHLNFISLARLLAISSFILLSSCEEDPVLTGSTVSGNHATSSGRSYSETSTKRYFSQEKEDGALRINLLYDNEQVDLHLNVQEPGGGTIHINNRKGSETGAIFDILCKSSNCSYPYESIYWSYPDAPVSGSYKIWLSRSDSFSSEFNYGINGIISIYRDEILVLQKKFTHENMGDMFMVYQHQDIPLGHQK